MKYDVILNTSSKKNIVIKRNVEGIKNARKCGYKAMAYKSGYEVCIKTAAKDSIRSHGIVELLYNVYVNGKPYMVISQDETGKRKEKLLNCESDGTLYLSAMAKYLSLI